MLPYHLRKFHRTLRLRRCCLTHLAPPSLFSGVASLVEVLDETYVNPKLRCDA